MDDIRSLVGQVCRDTFVGLTLVRIMGDGERLLDVWPGFSKSPIITEFGWSPLVELAFDMNRELISPSAVFEPFLAQNPSPFNAERYTPIPGLLVLHIRRGDFAEHCQNLRRWGSNFEGFNSFAALPDKLGVPADATEEARTRLYSLHCYPEIDEIVERVENVCATDAGRGLKNVYIMTNGPVPFVNELKAALWRTHHWNSIVSSRDIILNHEQKYVKQAVDMLIGQRAQVLIGNGVRVFGLFTGLIALSDLMCPSSRR